jgi:hypothetical protein
MPTVCLWVLRVVAGQEVLLQVLEQQQLLNDRIMEELLLVSLMQSIANQQHSSKKASTEPAQHCVVLCLYVQQHILQCSVRHICLL